MMLMMIPPDLFISFWFIMYYIIYKLNNDLPNPYILVVFSYIFVIIVIIHVFFSYELTRKNLQNMLLALIVSTLLKGSIIVDLYNYENKYDLSIGFVVVVVILYIIYITYRGYSIYDIYKVENLIDAKTPIEFYINKYILKNKLFL
jgi:hypothetical protein